LTREGIKDRERRQQNIDTARVPVRSQLIPDAVMEAGTHKRGLDDVMVGEV
jgi:hypothetical protein